MDSFISGGLEMLFSDQRHHALSIPATDRDGKPANIGYLIDHLCESVMQDTRKELFVLDNHLYVLPYRPSAPVQSSPPYIGYDLFAPSFTLHTTPTPLSPKSHHHLHCLIIFPPSSVNNASPYPSFLMASLRLTMLPQPPGYPSSDQRCRLGA